MKFKSNNSERNLIKKFERIVQGLSDEYLDLEEFELILDYYVVEGNITVALQACEMAMKQHPYCLELFLHQAQLLTIDDQIDEALQSLKRYPFSSEEYLLTKAFLFIKKEDNIKALTCIRDAKDQYGDSTEIQYCLGVFHTQIQDFSNAINYFKKSLEYDFENEAALADMTFCLEITDQLEDSVSYYKKIIDHSPYNHILWDNLGVIYQKLDKYKEALEAFEYATIIKDDYVPGYFHKANILVLLQEYAPALDVYKICISKDKNSADIYCRTGECYEYLSDWENAKLMYKKALEVDHNKEDALFGLGMILFQLQRFKEAIFYFKKTVALQEYNSMYWHMLARSEFKFGNETFAIEAFEEANKLQPDDKDIWLNWAQVYAESGNFEEAKNLVIEGINEIPEEGELYYIAFVYLLKYGNYKEAFQYLENALILEPEKQEMVYQFFDSLEAQKAISKFIEELK